MDYEKAIKKISLNDVKKFAEKFMNEFILRVLLTEIWSGTVIEAAKVLRQKLAENPA
ncbi:MAG: hypothetical protein CM1200mP28_01020 [Deltaproteobacteria bacterium]|nr:MAG: hypothetical protein CM1200mP28_01020 [Deltaproteobacteria bacterium]